MDRLNEINQELESYKDIIAKINSLKKERKLILNKIRKKEFETLPFEEQFKKFFKSKKGHIIQDISELSEVAPLFCSKFIDTDNFDRYQIYQIDIYAEEFGSIFDLNIRGNYKLYDIAKELMDNNIRGWKHDW